MSIKQREEETLRSYITHFNKEALSIDETDNKILVVVFTNRLRKGKFLFTLYKNDPKTISDVLYRATKYMNAEDALLAREEKPKKRERQKDVWQDRRRKTIKTGDWWEDRHSKPPLGGSQASPRWQPLLIKSWCRSSTRQPWHGLASWKKTPTKGPETSTVIFTMTTVTTRLNITTWSNK